PKHLLRDRDAIYGDVFVRRAKGLGIREILIAPRAPWQNPFAERVIGSIRRECLDHVIVFNERHLRRCCAVTSRTTTPRARISPSTTTALIGAKCKCQRACASLQSRRSVAFITGIIVPAECCAIQRLHATPFRGRPPSCFP